MLTLVSTSELFCWRHAGHALSLPRASLYADFGTFNNSLFATCNNNSCLPDSFTVLHREKYRKHRARRGEPSIPLIRLRLPQQLWQLGDVRFWHKADIQLSSANVRYWG
jgi:hypothetical protein